MTKEQALAILAGMADSDPEVRKLADRALAAAMGKPMGEQIRHPDLLNRDEALKEAYKEVKGTVARLEAVAVINRHFQDDDEMFRAKARRIGRLAKQGKLQEEYLEFFDDGWILDSMSVNQAEAKRLLRAAEQGWQQLDEAYWELLHEKAQMERRR